MANSMYDFGRESFLLGDIDYVADNIKLVLIDEADDTIDLANDQNLADRAVASRVATSPNLASKTSAAGVADAADPVITGVTGDQSESFDTYQDSGVESTSILIANIDTAVSGLPFTPNGGDLTVQLNAAGLLTL